MGHRWVCSSYSSRVEIYDPVANSWTNGSPLTTTRYWASAWVSNGKIYVAGGREGSSSHLNSIEVYDPVTNQWTDFGNLPESKYNAAAPVLGGKVYVVAGYNGSSYSNKVYAADLNASLAGGLRPLFPRRQRLRGRSDRQRRGGRRYGDAEQIVGRGGCCPQAGHPPATAGRGGSRWHHRHLRDSGYGREFDLPVAAPRFCHRRRQRQRSYRHRPQRHPPRRQLHRDGDQRLRSTTSVVATLDVNGSVTQGLVGWWKFDETNGTVAHDSSGNDNNGTLQGGAAWAQGKFGGALSFDGTGDWVDIGNDASLNITGPITVSTWIYPRDYRFGIIAQKGSANSYTWAYKWRVSSDDLYFTFYDSLSNAHTMDFTPKPNLNVWSNVVATYDGSRGEVYHDGDNLDSFDSVFTYGNASHSIIIGAKTTGEECFNGLVDDVRIYDRALSAAEIQALYDLGTVVATTTGGGATIVADSGPVTTENLSDGAVTSSKLSESILKYLRPEITTSPQAPGLVFGGQTVTLASQAEGKYLTYQWNRNGQPIAGETNATLSIAEVNATLHDGNYTLVVSNDFGSVTTQSTSLQVNGTQWNFTNAGVTGRTGPTQAQVNAAYAGGSLESKVTINSQGIQEWTVPATGTYTIEAWGGSGWQQWRKRSHDCWKFCSIAERPIVNTCRSARY